MRFKEIWRPASSGFVALCWWTYPIQTIMGATIIKTFTDNIVFLTIIIMAAPHSLAASGSSRAHVDHYLFVIFFRYKTAHCILHQWI